MNLQSWAERLAKCIQLELLLWRVRLSQDRIRAVAVDCHPWDENALTFSFLTDRESFAEEKLGKWAIADWRLYDCTSVPTANWPSAQALMEEAYQYYLATPKGREGEALGNLVKSCVEAMKSPSIAAALRDYNLTTDFAIFVGHPDAPKKNFYA